MEVTRKGWSGGKEGLGNSGNSEDLSSGCESRPTKAQPRRLVASLATEWATTPAIRRYARTWAVGCSPESYNMLAKPKMSSNRKAAA